LRKQKLTPDTTLVDSRYNFLELGQQGGERSMSGKPVNFVNPDTGEVEQGYIFWGKDRPKVQGGGWFMGFQQAFIALSQDKELTLDHHRVLSYLLGKLDFDNFIHLRQTDIVKALEIDKSRVSRALAVLKHKEIILVAPYKGVRCYKINSWWAWKGSVLSFQKDMKGVQEERKLKIVKSDKTKQSEKI